ncbi:MAG: hypothetical protein Kow0090_17230 [Myxococcota bacterium]
MFVAGNNHCPECGTEKAKENANFCYNCGYNLKTGSRAPNDGGKNILPFYFQDSFVHITLFFLTPIGVILMFLQPKPGLYARRPLLKIAIIVLFIILIYFTYEAYVQYREAMKQLEPLFDQPGGVPYYP